MIGSAQPAFTCSNSIELTSTINKVNNKDTRTTSFDVFFAVFEQILHFVLVFLLVTLSRQMSNGKKVRQLSLVTMRYRHNCNQNIFVTCCQIACCQKHVQLQRLALRGTHPYIKYLTAKIYNHYYNVVLFSNFYQMSRTMLTFSKHYSKCKTVSIKFRKRLQERRLPILNFSQDKPQNN